MVVAYCEAYTLGIISPNNSKTNVTMTTWKIKPMVGALLKSNRVWFIYVDSITIPIFTKLFDTSIVASNLFGLYRWYRMFSLFFSFIVLICAGDSEKKAVSLPDINPENMSRITSKMMTGMILSVSGLIVIFVRDKPERK